MNDSSPKSTFDKTTELLKVILWPLIVVFFIFLFWKPINAVIDKLPDMVANSESVTIGSLSLKIKNNIAAPPSEDIKKALKGLSEQAIYELITLDSMGSYDDDSWQDAHIDELIEKGLAKEIDCKTAYAGYRCFGPTKFGRDAHEYLSKVLTAFVEETNK